MGIKPDIMLGASGGVVCAYLALAADFNRDNLLRLADTLRTNLFIEDWYRSPAFINHILYMFKGSLYKQSTKLCDYVKELFPGGKRMISRVEILTMTYCMDTKRCVIISNRRDSAFTDICEDGNIERLSMWNLASTALPVIINPIKIDGKRYIDGGVHAPSPFTATFDQLISGRYKIIYITHTPCPDVSSMHVAAAINGMTDSNYIKEYEMLRQYVRLLKGDRVEEVSGSLEELYRVYCSVSIAILYLTVPYYTSNFSILRITEGSIARELSIMPNIECRLIK
jgi:hypothetical protein